MNPSTQYQLAGARIADLNREATQQRLAQALRIAPRLPCDQGRRPVGRRLAARLNRRLYAMLPVRPLAGS
jgi:hypothetical protein